MFQECTVEGSRIANVLVPYSLLQIYLKMITYMILVLVSAHVLHHPALVFILCHLEVGFKDASAAATRWGATACDRGSIPHYVES